MADLLLLLLLAAAVLPRAVETQGSCPGAAEFEAFCGSARRASVGNCLVCVASHPQFSSCPSSSLDAFCSGAAPPPPPAQRAAKPHIIMTLADDVGWASAGWNRPTASAEAATPNLDTLVQHGIQLTRFYTFKYCGPSRSAFLSGRNPTHVNVVNGHTTSVNPDDPVSGFSGIPTSMTSIAEKMVSAGYRAHTVGKWDGARVSLAAAVALCRLPRIIVLTFACCHCWIPQLEWRLSSTHLRAAVSSRG